MTFRYARHTNNLEGLVKFYIDVIGLKKIGEFKDHNSYNGVFLGFPKSDWHIEFTESLEIVKHFPDKDDLFVFYAKDDNEFNTIKSRIEEMQIPISKSKNPYWNKNGIEIADPDGFGVVITQKNRIFNS